MPTKRKNTNNADLSKILGKLLDGIIIVGKDGKIKYANISATALFNKSIEQLIGEEFGYIIVPQKVQEIQIIQEQRILFVQMLASSLTWEGKDACLISLRDVTALKKRELDLQVERQKLEQSNMELSQYASMASHDLREPVRKILVYAQRLMQKYSGQLQAEPFGIVQKMHKSAGRLNTIIESVAKYSRINRSEVVLSPVDLNQLIKQVIDDIEIIVVEKKVKVDVKNLPMLNGDAGLLYQLFLNLITNSIKYSKNNVSPFILIEGKVSAGVLRIKLNDNGLGFDNAYAKKIFEPFQRLHLEGYDGSGIGLAICKKVVEAHNGKIWAESVPNIGTNFFMEFPQVRKKTG